jgi:hypothetical protein
MYEHLDSCNVYYCPKCDRSVPKERLVEIDSELRERFGKSSLSGMRCPVCETEFIDLDKVEAGGERHVGTVRRKDAESG